ncbi:MAG TPA: cytochrome c oxidase subunit II, partial [Acetobacteraceae bacterium]|nr:cytochrome c oxidase subunit II [Acetobacteraceae bacterium]
MSDWQSAIDPRGPQAAQLGALVWLFASVAAAIWLAVMLVLVAALWRRRRAVAGERGPAIAVGVATAATVLVILGLTVASYVTTRRTSSDLADALVIQLKGYQWWWAATYAATRPAEAFTTANELHVPVGRPVRIELEAMDVIHSFWVPNLGGKKDAVPGHTTALWIEANQPGTYKGQCTEFCGDGHADMLITVVAHDQNEYATWAAEAVRQADLLNDPKTAAGRDAFLGG